MPYSPPSSSAGDATWACNAKWGSTPTVSIAISITIGDSATEGDADAALQDLVNVLSGRPGYNNVAGVKSYKADTSQTMQPSV